MKKSLLVAMVVIMGMTSFAQQKVFQLPQVNPQVANKALKADRKSFIDAPVKKNSSRVKYTAPVKKASTPISAFGVETIIGETAYDLQSNASVPNRLVYNANGSLLATWTFSAELNTTWSDRGSGYNFFDGTTWGTIPTSRIESGIRTGWPEVISVANGTEIVIAHAPAEAALVMSTRNPAGTGAWTTTNLTDLAPNSILWPRAASGGPDGNTVHLIALNEQATMLNGVTGAVSYSRSLDGGQTWDIKSIQIPGLDSSNYRRMGGDSYAITAKGNNVAVVYFGDIDRTVLAKSTDNGTTWTSKQIIEIPFIYDYTSTETTGWVIGFSDMNGDGIADTVTATDGCGAVILDNNGNAHVFWGNMRNLDDAADGSGGFWFPGTNGIAYWSELNPKLDPQIIGGAIDVDTSGILLDNATDLNTELGLYYTSLSGMPNVGIDSNGCLYLVYSVIMENLNSGSQFYKHIYASKSCDNGCTWSFPIDLTGSTDYDFYECVFPSMAHNVDSVFHLIFQRDGEPGLHVRGDEDAAAVNEIMHIKEQAARLDTVPGFCVGAIYPDNGVTVFCANDSILLTATCGSQWAWSTGATTQSTWVSTFGQVFCDITTPCGLMKDSLILAATAGGPSVTITPSATTACATDTLSLTTNNVSGASWAWSTTDSTQTISVIGPGTYSVTVTDCGGQAIESITINPFAAPNALATAFGNDTFCIDGSLTINGSGAGLGGTYLWSPNGETTSFITVDTTGNYYFIATNICGVNDTSNVVATFLDTSCVVGINEALAFSDITVYPNPNNGQFRLTFNKVQSDNYTVSIKNILGQGIYTKKLAVSGNHIAHIDISNYRSGVYFLTVTNSLGEQTQKIIVR